jgi:hypothetical protein
VFINPIFYEFKKQKYLCFQNIKIKNKLKIGKMSIVNVKVKHIRPKYDNLEEWMNDENNVYIGRRKVVMIEGRRFPPENSFWNNPFKVEKNGKGYTREEALYKYRGYMSYMLEQNPDLINELLKLRGKNLGCWCKPEPCHGDILLELIEKYSNQLNDKEEKKDKEEKEDKKEQGEQTELMEMTNLTKELMGKLMDKIKITPNNHNISTVILRYNHLKKMISIGHPNSFCGMTPSYLKENNDKLGILKWEGGNQLEHIIHTLGAIYKYFVEYIDPLDGSLFPRIYSKIDEFDAKKNENCLTVRIHRIKKGTGYIKLYRSHGLVNTSYCFYEYTF